MVNWFKIVVVIVTTATVGGCVLILTQWNRIAEVMYRSIFPWFEKNLPNLKPLINSIFDKVNDLMVPIIQTLRRNWRTMKQWFIGQLMYFQRISANVYLQKICSYFSKVLEDEKKFEEIIETSEIDPINIPPDFRGEVMGHTHSKINTTEYAEKVLSKVEEASFSRNREIEK